MIFSVLAIVALFGVSLAQVTCPTTVTAVLTNIYNALGGANWRTNNWFDSSDYCTWDGLSCNANGDIVVMDLSGMGLVGEIPDWIECLPFLKTLYLNNNSLVGPLPESLCTLQHIKYFQISNSGLYGNIPSCFCNLNHVQYFYVDGNSLNGTIPTCVNNMTFLREMHLFCNNLSGTVPTQFNDLAYLEELLVYCNTNLNCNTANITVRGYRCGTAGEDCDACPLTPGRCPPYIDLGDCGLYYPE